MKIWILFSAILLLQIGQNNGLDIVRLTPTKSCSKDRECATRTSCPYWIEKDIKLSQLRRGSQERKDLIEEYRSAICNKEDKGLCCPIESTLDLVEASDKSCSSESHCSTRDSCPFWSEKFEKLNLLQRGTPHYNNLRNEMVSAICNKKKWALCCPKQNVGKEGVSKIINPINDSPTYLPVTGECGTNPHTTPPKVFGGNKTKAGEYPFAVLLGQTVLRRSSEYVGGRPKPPQKAPKWVCGGTLINYWYVVTAAHCIGTGSRRITYLRLGEWTVGGFGSSEQSTVDLPPVQEFSIRPELIIVHKGYKKKFRNIENDIALIRLPRKPKLNLGVQFACLPFPEAAQSVGVRNWDSEVNGKIATVIGWGYSCYQNNSRAFCKDQYIGNKEQQYLEVPVVGNTACKDQGSYTLTQNQVCAGGEEGKGSCQGDSGGGLFIRKPEHGADGEEESPWYLLGIVSYGKPACGLGIPEVYTSVSKYLDWIKQKISK